MVTLHMCPSQVRESAFDRRDEPATDLSESPAPRLSLRARLRVAIDRRRKVLAEFEDSSIFLEHRRIVNIQCKHWVTRKVSPARSICAGDRTGHPTFVH
jgi:hypothetical protein